MDSCHSMFNSSWLPGPVGHHLAVQPILPMGIVKLLAHKSRLWLTMRRTDAEPPTNITDVEHQLRHGSQMLCHPQTLHARKDIQLQLGVRTTRTTKNSHRVLGLFQTSLGLPWVCSARLVPNS